jgi:hypothetical protein
MWFFFVGLHPLGSGLRIWLQSPALRVLAP